MFQKLFKEWVVFVLEVFSFVFTYFLIFIYFKGYFSFTVMTKYWLYSLCCTIYPWVCLTRDWVLFALMYKFLLSASSTLLALTSPILHLPHGLPWFRTGQLPGQALPERLLHTWSKSPDWFSTATLTFWATPLWLFVFNHFMVFTFGLHLNELTPRQFPPSHPYTHTILHFFSSLDQSLFLSSKERDVLFFF